MLINYFFYHRDKALCLSTVTESRLGFSSVTDEISSFLFCQLNSQRESHSLLTAIYKLDCLEKHYLMIKTETPSTTDYILVQQISKCNS